MNKPTIVRRSICSVAVASGLLLAGAAFAYDGTNCREPGNCWEPKPGFPDMIEGSQYDPRHDPEELNKQSISIREMEERNARRVAHFKETGEFIYDVSRLSEGDGEEGESDG